MAFPAAPGLSVHVVQGEQDFVRIRPEFLRVALKSPVQVRQPVLSESVRHRRSERGDVRNLNRLGISVVGVGVRGANRSLFAPNS